MIAGFVGAEQSANILSGVMNGVDIDGNQMSRTAMAGQTASLALTVLPVTEAVGAVKPIAAEASQAIKLNVVTRSKEVLGHIFRNSTGHVNPSTITSQSRYIKLFENVANDAAALNPNILSPAQSKIPGIQGFSKIFNNGKQVWVQVKDGKIFNAGVNNIPKP